MMEVIVEHDYIAKEPNELSLTKGDIIKDAVRKQLGWWEGTLNDKKGLFPDSNVKVIDKDPSVVLRNRKDVSRIRQCRVIFSYKQDHEDELNLSVGDIIDILGEEEEGWWRGILNGRQGVFPSNFVEEIVNTKINTSRENLTNVSATQEAAPSLHAKPSKILCEVKYPYKAQNTDELTLKEGDIVVLLSKDGQDPGWWKGELNGFIGVFPDNFVTVLPTTNDETPIKDEKRPKTYVDTPALKPTTISSQRKSLELQNNEKTETDLTSSKTTPPLPGKKPTIPVKKSPSSSGSTGGIFYGLKKKIVDVVDGATASKNISPPKTEPTTEHTTDNVFDDVQRRPLLSDVRASRPKAPGRRPPSVIGKDAEPGIMNGSADHNLMETLMETNYSSSIESDVVDNKPKLKEWEKHKAPWLEEMKQNQAKRGSNVPTGTDNKLKLTPTDRVNSEVEEMKPTKPFEKQPSPVIDKSKSVSGLSNRMKTPTNEFPVIRNKPNVPIPSRPQTIQNITNLSDVYLQKQSITPTQPKVSPVCNKTPSPSQKVTVIDPNVESNTGGGDSLDEVPSKYLELEQRIAKLEELLEKQQLSHQSAIEELRGKLQIETEMRMKLQVKFERFIGEGAIQQL